MAKTDLDDYFSYGIDAQARRVYFGDYVGPSGEDIGSFSQRSVELAVRALHRLQSEGPGKPIELYMNSGGGDVYAMLRLYDEILHSPCQIKFYGGGLIASAATWIMSACDERYLFPSATVMLHNVSDKVAGAYSDIRANVNELIRLQNKLYDIYAANSRMPREFWEDVCQRDLHITAEEAIALGLADKIVEPKKRGNLRKVRQVSLKRSYSGEQLNQLVSGIYARIGKTSVPHLVLNKPYKELEDPAVVVNEHVVEEEEKPNT